jgi:hypothetical protein
MELDPFPTGKSRADQCRNAASRVCHGFSLTPIANTSG